MCQFKDVFLGLQTLEDVLKDSGVEKLRTRRLCNSQSCLRLSGKHNDLDVVGRDTYHHTMFEMLGSWSFEGDYGKEQVIVWSLELLIDVWGLDPQRLYFTYFDGSNELDPDHGTRELWLQHGCQRGVPKSHVIGCGIEDNFWSMGETGPCGPCTEIHYDRQGGRRLPELVNQDDPDVLELWILVFMSMNRVSSLHGFEFEPLDELFIDTGMGLERVVSVLQGQYSNYDTDIFQPYFKHIEKHWGVRPYTGRVGSEDVDMVDTSYRVVCDHVRSLVFGIIDGGCLGHKGQGHILKTLHRRGLLYSHLHLGGRGLVELVRLVGRSLQSVYPKLKQPNELDRVVEELSSDERQFVKTIDLGKKQLRKLVCTYVKNQPQPPYVLSGEDMHLLQRSFGVNVELLEFLLQVEYRNKGVDIQMDLEGFRSCVSMLKKHSSGGC
jgi:alanyl-tRNA synthetase